MSKTDCFDATLNYEFNKVVSRKSECTGSVADSPRCACGCFLTIEGAWVGESHYDDEAKVYCSNPKCKLKKPNAADDSRKERND